MKILIYMMYWYPYEGALQPIYKKIFSRLTEEGDQVTIVTSLPHYRLGREERYSEFRGKWKIVRYEDGMKILRCWVFAPYFESPKYRTIFRLGNYLSFMVSSIGELFREGKVCDVIFSPSTPPILGPLMCLLCGKRLRKPVIYNIQDLYPEILEYQQIVTNRFVLKMLKRISERICQSVDRIIVISDNMKESLAETRDVNPAKVEVIPNFHDTEVIKPGMRNNAFAKEYSLEERFVVLFAGNIGYSHGLEYVIEAAAMLQNIEAIIFVILGRGDHKGVVEKKAKAYALKNVLFPPLQPYERMADVFASVDLGLVCLRKGFGVASVPSKFFAIMAAGKPVIAMMGPENDVAEIVRRQGVGTWVPPEDPEKLRDAILQYYGNRGLGSSQGTRGRALVEKEYSLPAIYEKYSRVLHEARGTCYQLQRSIWIL